MDEFDRGVLDRSSWHGLEELGVMNTAEDLIAHGQRVGSYPIGINFEELFTSSGIKLDGTRAIVGDYLMHPRRSLGVVGDRYVATSPKEWAGLIKAAVEAGAKPTGAFSLRDGKRVLATFEIGISNGLKTFLTLADSFDGSMRLCGGATSVRVVCANTLSVALSDKGAWAKLRHTSSLPAKIEALRGGIDHAIKAGLSVREAFHKAESMQLTREQAQIAFDALFPAPAEGAEKARITKMENARDDARTAAAMPINQVGTKGNLATLWNAATYLVDRTADGEARECRGDADRLDSLLFGARAERLNKIQETIYSILDGGQDAFDALARTTKAKALTNA